MSMSMQEEIKGLVEGAKVAYISSVSGSGYPNTKAMLTLERDNIITHYFSTNTSSKRVGQFTDNQKACIYFCSEKEFKGLMLVGEMRVLSDHEHKARLWREGFEMYYPKGINDEDYSVLQFTAAYGNYYHGLQNSTFTAEEMTGWGF